MSDEIHQQPQTIIRMAQEVLDIEANEILALRNQIDKSFVDAHNAILSCKGKTVVTGIGKSGHIGNKIASTLASTGTPSFFMHPAEASHGDLGMITSDDIVIALSNSGESSEITAILPPLKRRGVKLIAITGNSDSTLAKESDIHLLAKVEREACPLNLAPTASTTTVLALGDALAVSLLNSRGFKKEDFALHHPGGTLGRKLLVHVYDVMHKGKDIPKVDINASLREAIIEISQKGLGMTAIVDEDNNVHGLFTDGDLRRTLETHDSINTLMIKDVMTRKPRSIGPHKLAAEAAQLMQSYKISGRLLVVDDDNKLVGAIHFDDLLRAGVV